MSLHRTVLLPRHGGREPGRSNGLEGGAEKKKRRQRGREAAEVKGDPWGRKAEGGGENGTFKLTRTYLCT